MKIKDLIAELQRFDGDGNVNVEFVSKNVSGCVSTDYGEPVEVIHENDGRNEATIVVKS